MTDSVATGLIGIGGTIAGTVAAWFLGRATKESDDLRTIYAEWGAAAHTVVTTVISARENAEVAGAQAGGLSVDFIVDAINSDPKQWRATGIDQAKAALEKARFKVVISDVSERRVSVVVQQTERLAKLHPGMSFEKLEAGQKALEAAVTNQLRSSFRLRPLLDD